MSANAANSDTNFKGEIPNAAPFSTALQHILWKESKQIFPIFIVLFFGAILFGIVGYFSMDTVEQSAQVLCAITIAFAAMATAASAAVIFASERETGTDLLLQSTPISPVRMGLLKLGFGAICIFAFALVLGLGCWQFVSDWLAAQYAPNPVWHVAVFCYLMLVLELFVYTAFFSLLMRRTISAAMLGGALTLFVWVAVGASIYEPQIQTIVPRGIVLLVFASIDVLLAGRWLSVGYQAKQRALISRFNPLPNNLRWPTVYFHLCWQTFRQMGSVSFVGAIAMLLIFATIILGIGYFAITFPKAAKDYSSFFYPLMLLSSIGTALFGSFVFSKDNHQGTYQFFHQHHENARILWLARNSTWLVLLTALVAAVVGIVLLLSAMRIWMLSILIFVFMSPFEISNSSLLTSVALARIGVMLVTMLLAFAGGQWCSMYQRNSIFAIFQAVFVGVLVFGWVALMLSLQLQLWWSVLPLIAAFFLSTWWSAPKWIVGRGIRHWWYQALAPTFCVAVVTLALIPIVRVQQIQFPNSEASLPMTRTEEDNERRKKIADLDEYAAAYTSDEALEAAELYKQVFKEFVSFAAIIGAELQDDNSQSDPRIRLSSRELENKDLNIRQWPQDKLDEFLAANSKNLDRVRLAQENEFCFPFLNDDHESRRVNAKLGMLYQLHAVRFESAVRSGDLDLAFESIKSCYRSFQDCYSYAAYSAHIQNLTEDLGRWLAHPEQTMANLEQAKKWIRSRDIPERYVEVMTGGDDARIKSANSFLANRTHWASWYLNFVQRSNLRPSGPLMRVYWTDSRSGETKSDWSWEQERSQRLAKYLATRSLRNIYAPDSEREAQTFYIPNFPGHQDNFFWLQSSVRQFPVFNRVRKHFGVQDPGWYQRGPLWNYPNSEYAFRFLQLKIEVIKFALDHGRYPESNDELIQIHQKSITSFLKENPGYARLQLGAISLANINIDDEVMHDNVVQYLGMLRDQKELEQALEVLTLNVYPDGLTRSLYSLSVARIPVNNRNAFESGEKEIEQLGAKIFDANQPFMDGGDHAYIQRTIHGMSVFVPSRGFGYYSFGPGIKRLAPAEELSNKNVKHEDKAESDEN